MAPSNPWERRTAAHEKGQGKRLVLDTLRGCGAGYSDQAPLLTPEPGHSCQPLSSVESSREQIQSLCFSPARIQPCQLPSKGPGEERTIILFCSEAIFGGVKINSYLCLVTHLNVYENAVKPP